MAGPLRRWASGSVEKSVRRLAAARSAIADAQRAKGDSLLVPRGLLSPPRGFELHERDATLVLSSQRAAVVEEVMSALDGPRLARDRNLVLSAPRGAGKSGTLLACLASAMARRHLVLFVPKCGAWVDAVYVGRQRDPGRADALLLAQLVALNRDLIVGERAVRDDDVFRIAKTIDDDELQLRLLSDPVGSQRIWERVVAEWAAASGERGLLAAFDDHHELFRSRVDPAWGKDAPQVTPAQDAYFRRFVDLSSGGADAGWRAMRLFAGSAESVCQTNMSAAEQEANVRFLRPFSPKETQTLLGVMAEGEGLSAAAAGVALRKSDAVFASTRGVVGDVASLVERIASQTKSRRKGASATINDAELGLVIRGWEDDRMFAAVRATNTMIASFISDRERESAVQRLRNAFDASFPLQSTPRLLLADVNNLMLFDLGLFFVDDTDRRQLTLTPLSTAVMEGIATAARSWRSVGEPVTVVSKAHFKQFVFTQLRREKVFEGSEWGVEHNRVVQRPGKLQFRDGEVVPFAFTELAEPPAREAASLYLRPTSKIVAWVDLIHLDVEPTPTIYLITCSTESTHDMTMRLANTLPALRRKSSSNERRVCMLEKMLSTDYQPKVNLKELRQRSLVQQLVDFAVGARGSTIVRDPDAFYYHADTVKGRFELRFVYASSHSLEDINEALKHSVSIDWALLPPILFTPFPTFRAED
jgi:hypothetical protein